MSSSSDIHVLHRVIRFISGLAVSSFFAEVHVIGGENVPKDGPIIVASTHHNMILDPVILSVAFPHRRILHYWSKASLFANPVMRYILYSSGNIPVDRKSKDRQGLFKGTLTALSQGSAVALFPEGTSYTEPRIMQVKDGAAWAAREYCQWLRANPNNACGKDVVIIPTAIVYTNKSKYRSNVIMEFGNPITMDTYLEQFLSEVDGEPRAGVKRLTRQIEKELLEASINAPDWDTLYAARIARDLLWEKESSINLDDFVAVSQTLVDLFSTPEATANFKSVKRQLLEYYSLLETSHLTNSVLSSLPLPRTLDPNTPAAVPGRLYAVLILLRDSMSALLRLPFFFFPLIMHMPAYIMGRYGGKLAADEETRAQSKVVFGLLSLLLIYSGAFTFLWSMFMYSATGAVIAAGTVYLFAVYHIRVIDDVYERAKRCIAAWRVLVGVWMPKRFDMSLAALSEYTIPRVPPESVWIDKGKSQSPKAEGENGAGKQKEATSIPARRPPSRRLVRHVLKARVQAVKAVGGFFDQLGHEQKVQASEHLAMAHGGGVDEDKNGWRYAGEVIGYLKGKGAKIPTFSINGEWAALSSEGEGYTSGDI